MSHTNGSLYQKKLRAVADALRTNINAIVDWSDDAENTSRRKEWMVAKHSLILAKVLQELEWQTAQLYKEHIYEQQTELHPETRYRET